MANQAQAMFAGGEIIAEFRGRSRSVAPGAS